MALFPGDDMVDITTPDGRSMRLPSSIASAFPNLQPQQIGQPAPTQTEIAGPAAPAAQMPTDWATIEPLPPPAPMADAITAADPATPAPPPQPVQPEPARKVNDRDLAQMGATGALNEQYAALGDAAEAGRASADAEAKEAVAVADAYHARNEELDKAATERAKAAEDWSKRVDSTTNEYHSAAKAYADHKIDRSIGHPVLAAISVALGAIGSAMKNEAKNPALDMLMQQIDKSVQLQMADRDKLKDVAAGKRSAIDLVRTQSSDATARYNLAMAGMTEKAARQVEELKARSTSDRVHANADALVADLRLKGASYLDGAVTRKLQLDQEAAAQAQREKESRRQAGIAYSQLKQRKLEHTDEMKFKREGLAFDRDKLEADKAAALAAAQAKGGGEGAKQMFEFSKMNEERAIGNIATGELLLKPEGEKMLKQADAIDAIGKTYLAAAQSEQDPAKRQAAEQAAALHEQKAAEMRGEARIVHAFRTSPAQATALRASYAGAQTAVELVDDIKGLREKHGPKWLRTKEGQAAMQAKGTVLMMQLKNAWQLGVLSESDIELLDKATGGDPSKLTIGDVHNFLGAEGPESRLDAISDALQKSVTNDFKAAGFPGEVKLHRQEKVKPTQAGEDYQSIVKGRTPVEVEQGMGGGMVGNVAEGINRQYGANLDTPKQVAANAKQSGHGLAPEEQRAVGRLVTSSRGTGKEAEAARARLIALAKDSRASLANGVLNTLQDEAPDLYKQVVGTLPSAKPVEGQTQRQYAENLGPREQRQAADSIRQEVSAQMLAQSPIGVIRQQALGGDQKARDEIYRRVAAGDPMAKRVAAEIVAGVK